MVRQIEANRVARLDAHTAAHASREVLDTLLQLAIRNFCARGRVDEGDSVRISGGRIIANGLPIEHEGVYVCVRDIGNILPGTGDYVTWVDLNTCHCEAGVRAECYKRVRRVNPRPLNIGARRII